MELIARILIYLESIFDSCHVDDSLNREKYKKCYLGGKYTPYHSIEVEFMHKGIKYIADFYFKNPYHLEGRWTADHTAEKWLSTITPYPSEEDRDEVRLVAGHAVNEFKIEQEKKNKRTRS